MGGNITNDIVINPRVEEELLDVTLKLMISMNESVNSLMDLVDEPGNGDLRISGNYMICGF